MPISITPVNPGGLIGPGLTMRLQTDFIGPLPSTNVWTAELNTPGGESAGMGFYQLHSQNNPVQLTPMQLETGWQGSSSRQIVAQEGSQITVNVTIQPDGGGPAADTGSATFPWTNTAGVPELLTQVAGGGTGLTPEESVQLQQTQQATWPEHLVDQLAVASLGIGTSDTPIAANLTSPVFGVIVRIHEVPPELTPKTPDGDYWVTTLAVVRVFRGTDIWLRIPIHTSSRLINLWVEGLALGLADAVLSAGWLLQLSIQVDFLPGVSGEVLLMRLP